MKNKKGFTLVELLVVITLIGLLTIIAIPSGIAISNKVKRNMLDTKIEQIESAAIIWGQINKSNITKKNAATNPCPIDASATACVTKTISELLAANAIEPDGKNDSDEDIVKNSTNDEELNSCNVIIYIKNKRVHAAYQKSDSDDTSITYEEKCYYTS